MLSIDIGIHHMGLVWAFCEKDVCIVDFDCINIMLIKCNRNTCLLHHSRSLTDYINHLFVEFHEWFENAEVILIERQPILGQVAVEQLIFSKYREKARLIAPRSIHTHYGWNYIGTEEEKYEKRKHASIRIAESYLSSSLKERLQLFDRQHDITDAICMLYFWFYKYGRQEYHQSQMVKHYDIESIDIFFSQFRAKS